MRQQPRVALVVGAGDYIGAAIAKRFAAGGFTLAVGRRRAEKLEPLVAELIPAIEQRTGARFVYVPVLLCGVLDELLARAADPDVKQALLSNTGASVARGVFGSPSFFVGDELFFGKDRLREVEEEIEAQRAG